MPLGVNQITPSSAPNFIPQVWRNEVRIARKSKFVMKDVAYELPIGGEGGNQFHIPNLSNLVASTKVPNAPVNLLAPNEGEFVLTIDKHKEVSILVEDITEVQETYYIRSRYTKQMGAAAANALDDDLLGLRLAFTQTISASAVGITEAKLLATKQTMDESDVPPDNRFLVIPPAGENDLLSINRFVAADVRQNVADMIGMGKFIGRIHGFSVMMTNRVKAGDNGRPGIGGGAAGTYFSLACHGEATMYGMPKPMRIQSDYKLELLGTLVVCDEIYGVGQYRNDHGVIIQSV